MRRDSLTDVFRRHLHPHGRGGRVRTLFEALDGRGQMGFARDSAGAIWQVTMGSIGVLERIRP